MRCGEVPGLYRCPVPLCLCYAAFDSESQSYIHSQSPTRYKCPVCGSDNVRNECKVFIVTDPNTGEWVTEVSDIDTRPDENGSTSCDECDHDANGLWDFDTRNPDHGEDPPCAACGAPESVCECA
jgi:hypothetical protein